MVTAIELRERIENSHRELTAVADATGLAATGPDGWTVKDHLVHIAVWEHSLLALIEGRDRLAAMGLQHVEDEGSDAVNDLVWKMHRDDAPAEALSYFRESHEQLMTALVKLSSDDLQRGYAHYQPHTAGDPDDDKPVLGWVVGNTYEHYEEHIGWIKQLVPASR
jgi:acyl-CoA-binding protein